MSQKQDLKAYLLLTTEVLAPFQKKGHELNFAFETLKERLERQFQKHGLILEPVSDLSSLSASTNRILVTDRTVVSNRALDLFVKAARSSSQGLQLEVDTQFDEAIAFDESPKKSVLLDLFYHPSGSQHSQPHLLARQDVYEVRTGMPDPVYRTSNARVVFPLVFGLTIRSWVDYLRASNLICREYTSQSVSLSSKFLPQSLVNFCLRSARISKTFNRIGKNCQIHPTAILEGCVVGDNVEIGPYSFLRASVIGSGASIREQSSIKASMIGAKSFVMPCDLFNAFIGNETVVFTSIFHNSIIGDRSFIGGGTGFSDFNAAHTTILTHSDQSIMDSETQFLGSAIGNDCFLGAGLIFKSGQIIPSGTQVLNPNMISSVPSAENQLYAANQGRLMKIPKSFIQRPPKP